jgi:hypothetical protein
MPVSSDGNGMGGQSPDDDFKTWAAVDTRVAVATKLALVSVGAPIWLPVGHAGVDNFQRSCQEMGASIHPEHMVTTCECEREHCTTLAEFGSLAALLKDKES